MSARHITRVGEIVLQVFELRFDLHRAQLYPKTHAIGESSNLGFSMNEESKKAINRHMEHKVHDDGDNDRK